MTEPEFQKEPEKITKKLAAVEVLKEMQKTNYILLAIGVSLFLCIAPLNLNLVVGGAGLMITGYAYITNKKKIDYLKITYGI